jgi:hypothetical protein
MNIILSKNYIYLAICYSLLVITFTFINLGSRAGAEAVCIINGVENTCPSSSQKIDGDPAAFDTDGCYSATASSSGRTPFRATECPTNSSGADSSTGSNPGRPGSTSLNCLQGSSNPGCNQLNTTEFEGSYTCGRGEDAIKTSINLGCRGDNYPGSGDVNPIVDMAFALFRFLSVGVGLVVVGSIIWAGIQYSAARGNPQATEASMKRIMSSFGALLLYLFIFAIANFLVPGGIFL